MLEDEIVDEAIENIKADIIILGNNLPGIVTAHKLRQKFGSSMELLVLDLPKTETTDSKQNVAFTEDTNFDIVDKTSISKRLLCLYANELNIPLHEAPINSETTNKTYTKIFQYRNGHTVSCEEDYHNFEYLNFLERLELNQYQRLIDEYMKELFYCKNKNALVTSKLAYYDRTLMETHLCECLFFENSREIMRIIVRLVCGSSPKAVSLLFYLHQCYRASGCRNHIDGINTRMREKVLGCYRKRIKQKLLKCINDITVTTENIDLITTYSDEEVVLESTEGANYVCNWLAMALRPDELENITLDKKFLTDKIRATLTMKPGRAKKFFISYKKNFWRDKGFSGDILSVRGPILWATEKPKYNSDERYPALVGYIKAVENTKEAVLKQLVQLYGEEASDPLNYRENLVADIFIPRAGDYVAITKDETSTFRLEWAALDIFADGDVAGAIQAGHTAFVNLVNSLRPQAQSYEDVSVIQDPIILENFPVIYKWVASINYISGLKTVAISSIIIYLGYKLWRYSH